jgi:hypothetical protein
MKVSPAALSTLAATALGGALLCTSGCGGRLDLGYDDDGGGIDAGSASEAGAVLPARSETIALDRFGTQGCGILASGQLSCWGTLPVQITGTFVAITNVGGLCGVTTAGTISCAPASGLTLAGSDYVRVAAEERVCGLTSAGVVRCSAGNGAAAQSLPGPYIDVDTTSDVTCELAKSGIPFCQNYDDNEENLPLAPLATLQTIETNGNDTDLNGDTCALTSTGLATCTSASLTDTTHYDEASFAASGQGGAIHAYCGIAGGALSCRTFGDASIATPPGTYAHVYVSMAFDDVAPVACATDTAGKLTCFLLDGTMAQPTIGSPDTSLVFMH